MLAFLFDHVMITNEDKPLNECPSFYVVKHSLI